MTRAAPAALVLAVLGMACVLASGPGTRFGLWPWQAGLALFALAGLLGVGAMIAAAFARRMAMFALGALAAALPVASLVQALSVPRINDVNSTLSLAVAPDLAFGRARTVAEGMGWEITKADAKAGRLDAVATTFWFGFKDDVEVRVAATPAGSQVEVRSKSRVGKGDSGANAKRIQAYFERLK